MRLRPTHRPPAKVPLFAAGATLVCALAATVATFSAFSTPGATDDEATLPTPFSAAEIRDAWPEGFWLDTRTTSAEGERLGRTIVTEWGAEKVTMVEVVIEEGAQPTAEQIAAAQSATMTWDELEGHARFDASRTTRERERHTTALGAALEGWTYRVRGSEGAESVFFFADDFPGPPVLYWQTRAGERLFTAEQVARRPAP